MYARVSAFVIWSLVAAIAVFWLLRLAASPVQAPAYAVAVGKSNVVRGDLDRLFGAPPIVVAAADPVAPASSRFKLIGVMAPKAREAQSVAGRGLALIAVDGKAPKAYAVGAPVDGGLVLQSVGLRTASIGSSQGARSMLLELPALAPPATGVLSGMNAGGGAPVPAVGSATVGGPQPGGRPSFGAQVPAGMPARPGAIGQPVPQPTSGSDAPPQSPPVNDALRPQ